MSASPPALGSMFLVPPYPVRRFSVDEYHRLIQAGILTEEDPVELLDGWITPKMPRNPTHDSFLTQANRVLSARIPQSWHLRIQAAVALATSEPEPDLAVVFGPDNRYRASHPVAADIALLVEVSDSSLSHDRVEKGRLYAAAAIPVYWVVNLVDGRVEVYTDPSGPSANPGYRQRQDYGPQDGVPLQIGGQAVGPVPGAELLL